jgi:uncharacterized membrane protein required for colicin V production
LIIFNFYVNINLALSVYFFTEKAIYYKYKGEVMGGTGTSTGSAIVDIIALVFIVVFALRGLIRGFAKSFVDTFGSIISLVIAILLSSTLTNFLESTFSLVTSISGSLKGSLGGIFGEALMNTPLSEVNNEILAKSGIGGWLITIILKVTSDVATAELTLGEILAPTIAYYLVSAVAIIVLFIVLKLLMRLFAGIVEKLYALPFVKTFDKLLGLAFGIISAVIYLQLAYTVLGVIPLGFIKDILVHVQASAVMQFVNKINLFGLILNGVSVGDISAIIKKALKIS